jgi:HD superfamily phosphohydrolase
MYVIKKKGVKEASDLFMSADSVVKWVYAHKLVKQKLNELQRRLRLAADMLFDFISCRRFGKAGALLKHCVTRWWSAVEVMCRLLQYKRELKCKSFHTQSMHSLAFLRTV